MPYPVPFAEILWDVVVMPDTIANCPSFDRWGFAPHPLNEALTLHELGHIVANRSGIRSSKRRTTLGGSMPRLVRC